MQMPDNDRVRPRQPRAVGAPRLGAARTRPLKAAANKQAASAGGSLSAPAHEMAIHWLPLEAITASQRNPRRKLGGIDELAASLDAHGILQPVIVRPVDGHYELVAGHRRVQAARRLGWRQIAAIVRSETD